MDKNKLLSKLFGEKTKDYTYFSFFFIIFSIFILFAIRPSLSVAFSLGKEERDLIAINAVYEKVVMGIVETQSLLENNREKLPFVYRAISNRPQVNKITKDLEEAGVRNNVRISKIDIQEINLIGKKENNIQKIKVGVEAQASFSNLLQYIKDLHKQRRLKAINKLTVLKESSIATSGGTLKFTIELEGFYL